MADTMSRPATAAELFERAEAAWPRFASGVRHVGLRHLDDRTPAGWRYRDLIAHATVWHRICVENLEHLRAHGTRLPGPFPAVDEVNADAARSATGVDPKALVHELEASWEAARDAIAGLSDPDLLADEGWVVDHVAENTWEHYDEHLPELRAARPATVATFLARLDDDWGLMRTALERLGTTGLDRPTGKAWRYRDLVAHANGWLVDAVERLPAVRADPQSVFADIDVDAVNAANLEVRRDRSAEELIAESEASFSALRSAITALTDEELTDRRISGFLAARSYLHVDEHLAELETASRG